MPGYGRGARWAANGVAEHEDASLGLDDDEEEEDMCLSSHRGLVHGPSSDSGSGSSGSGDGDGDGREPPYYSCTLQPTRPLALQSRSTKMRESGSDEEDEEEEEAAEEARGVSASYRVTQKGTLMRHLDEGSDVDDAPGGGAGLVMMMVRVARP